MTLGKMAFWASVALLYALGIALCALAAYEWRSWRVDLGNHQLLVDPDTDVTSLGQAVLVEGTLQSVARLADPPPLPLILGQSERLTLGKRSRWQAMQKPPEVRFLLKLASGKTVQVRWINPVLGQAGAKILNDPQDFFRRWVGFVSSDTMLCRTAVESLKPIAFLARDQGCQGGDRTSVTLRNEERAVLGVVLGAIALALATWLVWVENR